ncbi:hypothetical protein [Enterovirga sp.]|jgi:hypothetical protein|uniref:hypothetical protein n=1 Tax=Enterovirga sp. TaxID=2026350 RepID=UPI002628307E|nr:hypothetical protein [Enterovirga sp.]MDB5589847.1 hypothetical protein [Enterovirga sp.]
MRPPAPDDDVPPPSGLAITIPVARPRPHALRQAAVTIYVTLLLLGLLIPGSIVGALRERPPGPVTDVALALAEPIHAGLERLGVPALYGALKERFRAVSCGAPDSGNPC